MLTNNRVVAAYLILLVLFWPAYLVMPARAVPYILDIINALGLTAGVPVLWRYGPDAYRAIKKVLIDHCPLTRGPLLVLGIELTWSAMVIRTIHIWAWRYYGESDGGLDTSIMAFAALLIVPGGACHLLASTMPHDNVSISRLSTSILAGSALCGVALGAIVALLRWLQ